MSINFGEDHSASLSKSPLLKSLRAIKLSEIMKKWLKETEEALSVAVAAFSDGTILLQNLYMLAPIIYSERQKTKNELLIQEMIEANDKQVTSEWALDEESKGQYKFHFVSSYLFCYVVAGKIDEFKYDRIMEYVNSQIDLFTEDYGIE